MRKFSVTPKKMVEQVACKVCGNLHYQPTKVCLDCSALVEGKWIGVGIAEFWEKAHPLNRWRVNFKHPAD